MVLPAKTYRNEIGTKMQIYRVNCCVLRDENEVNRHVLRDGNDANK